MARHLRQHNGSELHNAYTIVNRYQEQVNGDQQARIDDVDNKLSEVMKITMKVSKVPPSFTHHS